LKALQLQRSRGGKLPGNTGESNNFGFERREGKKSKAEEESRCVIFLYVQKTRKNDDRRNPIERTTEITKKGKPFPTDEKRLVYRLIKRSEEKKTQGRGNGLLGCNAHLKTAEGDREGGGGTVIKGALIYPCSGSSAECKRGKLQAGKKKRPT